MTTTFKSCLICNTYQDDCISVSDSEIVLKSGNKLMTIVSKILDEQVIKHSGNKPDICKLCYKYCIEYDQLHCRLKEIKTDLKHQHKTSVLKVDSENFNVTSPDSTSKKMLPVAKLNSLPNSYIINVQSTSVDKKRTSATNIKINPMDNIKPGTSLLSKSTKTSINSSSAYSPKPKLESPSLKRLPRLAPKLQPITLPNKPTTRSLLTSVSNLFKKPSSILTSASNIITTTSSIPTSPSNILRSPSSILTSASTLLTTPDSILTSAGSLLISSSSILTSTSNLLPTPSSIITNASPILTSSVNTNLLSQDVITIADDLDAKKVNVILHEMNEEHPMDEECTYVSLKADDISEANDQQGDEDDDDSDQELIKITIPSIDGGSNNDEHSRESEDYVIGKVEIMEGDHELEDNHAILMEENGSIIRFMSGQKFIYNDKEILIIPEQESDNGVLNQEEEVTEIDMDLSESSETTITTNDLDNKTKSAILNAKTDEMYKVECLPSVKNAAQSLVKPDGGEFICILCEKSKSRPLFSSGATTMMKHVREVHNARVYICATCGEIMRRRTDFTDHTTMHADEASISLGLERNVCYECHYCSKKFLSRNLLIDHVNVHDGKKPYQCNTCSKKFTSKYTFQAHQKTHLDRPRPFSCETCGKAFYTLQNLTQHVKIHEAREEFECLVCHKTFGSQHNLEVHGIVHSGKKPFLCGICNKRFARRAEIRDHMRTHTGERPFKCDVCDISFSQRSNLQSHKRATHLNDKRYLCTECPKKFKRRRLLDYHIKACHTGERPYQCSLCGATFVYPEHYKKHIRSHTGQKPYSCTICQKTFSSRDNRNVHMFTHSDRKPYECVICGANYMRKPQLFTHMKSFGHLSEQIMINQPRLSTETNKVTTDHRLLTINGSFTEEETEKSSVEQIFTVDFDTTENEAQLFTTETEDADYNIVKTEESSSGSANPGIVAKNSSGGVVFRLVQMQLDGEESWVTLEH